MKGTPSLAKWISQVSAVRVLSAKRTCLSIRLTLSIEFGGGGYYNIKCFKILETKESFWKFVLNVIQTDLSQEPITTSVQKTEDLIDEGYYECWVFQKHVNFPETRS